MTPWAALVEPNWREMVFELRRFGITDVDAAEQIGVPVGTYRAWKYGTAKPSYMNGRRFVEYHERMRKTKIQTG